MNKEIVSNETTTSDSSTSKAKRPLIMKKVPIIIWDNKKVMVETKTLSEALRTIGYIHDESDKEGWVNVWINTRSRLRNEEGKTEIKSKDGKKTYTFELKEKTFEVKTK
jgi:hypothetical protein